MISGWNSHIFALVLAAIFEICGLTFAWRIYYRKMPRWRQPGMRLYTFGVITFGLAWFVKGVDIFHSSALQHRLYGIFGSFGSIMIILGSGASLRHYYQNRTARQMNGPKA